MRTYLAVALVVVPLAAEAREWQFPKYNFAVTAPDYPPWELAPKHTINKYIVFRIGDRFTHRVFSVFVYPSNHPERLFDDTMIEEFEKEQQGHQKVRAAKTSVAGMPGYEWFGHASDKGGSYSVLHSITSGDGQVYLISITQYGGNPTMDPELGRMLQSFRFLQKPGVGKKRETDPYEFESAMFKVAWASVALLVFALILRSRRQARARRAAAGADGPPSGTTRSVGQDVPAGSAVSSRPDVPVATAVSESPVAVRCCPVCGHLFGGSQARSDDLTVCPGCGMSVRPRERK